MEIVKWPSQTLRLMMATISTAIVTLTAAPAQQPGQQAAPVPNFSGTWARPYFGVELPLSGPGPVTNSLRCIKMSQCPGFQGRDGVESLYGLVGDHTNPILKPQAAEVVKKIHGRGVCFGKGFGRGSANTLGCAVAAASRRGVGEGEARGSQS